MDKQELLDYLTATKMMKNSMYGKFSGTSMYYKVKEKKKKYQETLLYSFKHNNLRLSLLNCLETPTNNFVLKVIFKDNKQNHHYGVERILEFLDLIKVPIIHKLEIEKHLIDGIT